MYGSKLAIELVRTRTREPGHVPKSISVSGDHHKPHLGDEVKNARIPKMAVSESILSSWKTPFSTPIRKDENACRDLFQNSEKLLASAVSICRLKGSVECQTGGLITVCEELQSLIRLAFSGELAACSINFLSERNLRDFLKK